MNQIELREQFFAWQCRIRQMAMREDEGRPAPGMCPKVLDTNGETLADKIITMIIRGDSAESTDFFRFQVQKNHDPKEVRGKALTYLQATHYHGPREFMDCLTAMFGEQSAFSDDLLVRDKCILEFKQFNQGYRLQCSVSKLNPGEAEHSATLWHNRCFNPSLTDNVTILKFEPDWLISSLLDA